MIATGVTLFADVSEHSGTVDFPAYRKAGHSVLGYKVSEGRTYLDKQAIRNRDQCLATGTRGLAYHFLFGDDQYYNDSSLWAKQAEFFLQYAPDKHAHCLDVEMLAPAGRYLHVREWVNAYRVHLPNHPLLVYSNYGLWVNRSKVPYSGPVGTLLWHAGYKNGLYTSATGTLEQQWAAINNCTNSMTSIGYPQDPPLWQYTDHAVVPGVPNRCDGNAFIGSLTDWDAQLVNGIEDGDMSQADVNAITAYIDQKLSGKPNIGSAVWNSTFGKNADGSDRTAGQMLSEGSQADNALNEQRADDSELRGMVNDLAAAVARIEAQTKPPNA